jgi:hypothetical protein
VQRRETVAHFGESRQVKSSQVKLSKYEFMLLVTLNLVSIQHIYNSLRVRSAPFPNLLLAYIVSPTARVRQFA